MIKTTTENTSKQNDSRRTFIDKKSINSNFTINGLTNRLKRVANDIDKYDYESNCQGCVIVDYDKFERHRNHTIIMLIGIIGLYFGLGLLVAYSSLSTLI